MKLYFQILVLCFLTGCFEEENPPPKSDKLEEESPLPQPDKPEKSEEQVQDEKKPIDPFDLMALLQKPLEDFPAGIPDYGSSIVPKSLAGSFVLSESLEGTWYGAFLGNSSPVKGSRVYLQFRSDQSFHYGCVYMSEKTDKIALLIEGQYSIEAGNLELKTDHYKKYTIKDVIDEQDLRFFTSRCGSRDWKRSELTITIPLRQLDLDTMVLFDEAFSNAEVFLVRKQ